MADRDIIEALEARRALAIAMLDAFALTLDFRPSPMAAEVAFWETELADCDAMLASARKD